MSFNVPASEKDNPENRFEFTIGEKAYSVPKLGFAPVEASLLFEQGFSAEGLLACSDDPEIAADLRRLNQDQLNALEAAWVKASRVAPGESRSSAGS